jgi:hypothetical protein
VRSIYLNADAASTADILAAFPADLIANHTLCVEFTDVYDQLYITVDSEQITDEFFEVYSTIEEQVENTIDDVISVKQSFSTSFSRFFVLESCQRRNNHASSCK